ncbi:MAG TPA: antitoxin VapB family protein [Candidatus Deferrimicrobium sp.]|nr:antitoxin VapB family protein [Candidatus Deferrimicrobium sp.]
MTTIHVKEDTWKKLNVLKEPGESMDDVIRKLIEILNVNREIHESLDNSDSTSFEKLLEEFCNIADEETEIIIAGSKRGFQKQISRDKL